MSNAERIEEIQRRVTAIGSRVAAMQAARQREEQDALLAALAAMPAANVLPI